MDGKTVELNGKRVLCFRHNGPYPGIGTAFEKLGGFAGRIGVPMASAEWLAIFHDDPQKVAPEELRSDACVTIGEEITIPEDDYPEKGFHVDTIPAGKYATTRHLGSYEGLPVTWGRFMSEWLPAQGLTCRPGYCFEHYVNNPQMVPADELITDLYEPVE